MILGKCQSCRNNTWTVLGSSFPDWFWWIVLPCWYSAHSCWWKNITGTSSDYMLTKLIRSTHWCIQWGSTHDPVVELLTVSRWILKRWPIHWCMCVRQCTWVLHGEGWWGAVEAQGYLTSTAMKGSWQRFDKIVQEMRTDSVDTTKPHVGLNVRKPSCHHMGTLQNKLNLDTKLIKNTCTSQSEKNKTTGAICEQLVWLTVFKAYKGVHGEKLH